MIIEKFVDHVGPLAEFLPFGRSLIREKRGKTVSIFDRRTPTNNTEGCLRVVTLAAITNSLQMAVT